MVAWGWLGLVAMLYSGLLTDSRLLTVGGLAQSSIHHTMAWLLAASMAVSAAGSFRRERESGVLELLLVSPVGEDQLIMGRLRGLWTQFLPAGILLVAVWCFLTSLFGFSNYYGGAPDLQGVVYYLIGFLGVPVIGLYFSLACRTFLAALLATLGVGLFAAPILASWVWWFSGLSRGGGLVPSDDFLVNGPLLPCQIALTVICWFGLSGRLKRRTFPVQRQGS
jgi:ABC-type transport system involved in multi-copper enzyme maturation permease subunit